MRKVLGLHIALLLLALTQSSCLLSISRTPDLQQIFAAARERHGKRPIIFVPGILGSELVDRRTGKVVWPASLGSSPRGLALPTSPDLTANRDDLDPGKIIETYKFASLLPKVDVYRGLLDALRLYGGYKEGNWDNPAVDGDQDTLYLFSYDWRRDNVETARELLRRIQSLKQKLNRPDLRFNIVAHSMGGLIARYAAMYGDVDLSRSAAPSPNWNGAAHIQRVIMLGVPNEGSMDAFATILRGYSVTGGLRSRLRIFGSLSKELAFSSPSVFELLPDVGSIRFLDENLKPLPINFYDPAAWRTYGWSSAVVRASPGSPSQGESATEGDSGEHADEDRDRYLAVVLDRARRFHEALDAPAGKPPVDFFLLAGDCEETLNAPIIVRDQKHNRWLTLTEPREFRATAGRKVSRDEAAIAMSAPGDGRVTRSSALAENLGRNGRATAAFDSGLSISYAVFGCEVHGSLPNSKILLDNLLTAIAGEVIK